MIYTGKDQFQKGIAILTMLSFILPYFFIHVDGVSIYTLIMLAVYLFILKQELPFLILLYKHGGKNRTFIHMVVITIIISFSLSIFPKNYFPGYSLLVYSLFPWYVYLATFSAGKAYEHNKVLAESTGNYRLSNENNNP